MTAAPAKGSVANSTFWLNILDWPQTKWEWIGLKQGSRALSTWRSYTYHLDLGHRRTSTGPLSDIRLTVGLVCAHFNTQSQMKWDRVRSVRVLAYPRACLLHVTLLQKVPGQLRPQLRKHRRPIVSHTRTRNRIWLSSFMKLNICPLSSHFLMGELGFRLHCFITYINYNFIDLLNWKTWAEKWEQRICIKQVRGVCVYEGETETDCV